MAESKTVLPRRGGWLLFAAGLPGVAAVTLLVLPLLLQGRLLAQPLWLIELAVGAQSALLLALAVFIGCRCAPRVGLGAPLVGALLGGRDWRPVWRRQWLPGLVGGALGAGLLLGLPALAPASLLAQAGPPDMPGLARLLYGGITEELLLRWGLMSLIAWSLWRVLQRDRGEPHPGLFWSAIVLSALLFGLGHLPAAKAILGPLTPEVIAYLLLGNGVFGLLAGWLFWRRGLEAAMLAHILAHGLAMLAGTGQ
ncbi:CPBP family intramembrane glutamic endopeptidase [Roseateles oligotrophus]|uniref:CPBP family intramembrane metalloprotease n=1 Tax=Roseateles oligotrophus TaxID=1769250 RepID=A0ABT2Y9L6_9BURK|nr:CPBP family intramembrane glutamic endopeptidase [Roseateles oligotrophus]MCV2366999.1 CPBP family intramembrane metalloprotease [Roseateles oligotrophus]